MEVLVGHCLRENTGSWHPKRQRAILWHRGSGTGEWKDSYLQNRCLANFWFQHWCPSESLRYLSRPGVINTEFTAYKIRKKKKRKKEIILFFFFFLSICSRPRRKLQSTVLLTAESAESTSSLFMQNGRIGGATLYENIWQIHLLCAVSCWWPLTNWRSTTCSRSLLLSGKKIICVGLVTSPHRYKLILLQDSLKDQRSLPGWMVIWLDDRARVWLSCWGGQYSYRWPLEENRSSLLRNCQNILSRLTKQHECV